MDQMDHKIGSQEWITCRYRYGLQWITIMDDSADIIMKCKDSQ